MLEIRNASRPSLAGETRPETGVQGRGGKADQGPPPERYEVSGVKELWEGKTLGRHEQKGRRQVSALSGPVHYRPAQVQAHPGAYSRSPVL